MDSKKRKKLALAEAVGMAQSEVSRLERREDHHVSTLRKVVEALGGEVEVSAEDTKRKTSGEGAWAVTAARSLADLEASGWQSTRRASYANSTARYVRDLGSSAELVG